MNYERNTLVVVITMTIIKCINRSSYLMIELTLTYVSQVNFV